MENMINRFYNLMRKNGWTILRQDSQRHSLPESISKRYNNLPSEWVKFLNSISVCIKQNETAWFLCLDDFNKQDDNNFKWNEFEIMSLQAAVENNDTEWQNAIVDFWNKHLPIYLSVNGDYSYYAIRISDGFIVQGTEPEFEETTDIAPSFVRFIEMIYTGELII